MPCKFPLQTTSPSLYNNKNTEVSKGRSQAWKAFCLVLGWVFRYSGPSPFPYGALEVHRFILILCQHDHDKKD